MKSVLSLAILLSFIGIAVFGIFAMGHMGEHGGCIAATASGGLCPGEANPLAEIAFHLEAFKGFSTATFPGFMAGMTGLLMLLSLAFAYIFRSLIDFHVSPSLGQQFSSSPIGGRSLFGIESVRSWLALHENSPSAF
ncbi:MAG: hypothetical protein Q8P49_00625 [Candidatus Liptonbacteria bacterium]|nr:hypothetical protein [Candidatus Liptonbacteria bacterium]